MTIAYSRPGNRSVSLYQRSVADAVRRYMLSARSRRRQRTRIAILDDHPIIGLGMATLLHHQADFEVALTETSATRFLDTLKENRCDVAVVDFHLPTQPCDGADFIRLLRRQHPELIVITFSGGRTSDIEYAAYHAGAHGCVPKGERLLCIADVIRLSIRQPHTFHTCSQGASQHRRPRRPDDRLTPAEAEILRNLALGLSVTQTAVKLVRSSKTVSTHKRRAMKKLGLADDLSLALYLNERFERAAGA